MSRPVGASARYHVVGAADTGPVGAGTLIGSLAQFQALHGPRTTVSAPVWDDLALFFSEGGAQAYVTRAGAEDPASYRAALDTAGVPSGVAVAAPGHGLGEIAFEVAAHAAATAKIALLAGDRDQDPAQLAAAAAPLAGLDHVGVFHPWVSTATAGTTRTWQPPTGYAAASRARAHLTTGYWGQPAGTASLARTVRHLRFPTTVADTEAVSTRLVSPLVSTRDGVALYGWWSQAADQGNFPTLRTRDLLNNIAADLGDAYDRLVTHNWDTLAKLRAQASSATRAVLASVAAAGGLAARPGPDGTAGDPGYTFTVTTPTVQPDTHNELVVRVLVRPTHHPVVVAVRVFRVPILEPFPVLEVP